MCGIAGAWHRDGGSAEDLGRLVASMTDRLAHRGPDDSGVWTSAPAGIALGHRRLSIIDLSPTGHQPMQSRDGRYVISYNGEIYNFGDLRTELETQGVRFRGRSDTEVIVEGIARFGVQPMLTRLNGMFALALWDEKERRLHLARDRMGEKPLYWTINGATVLFGSELKALQAHPGWPRNLHRGAVAAFMRHGYVPGPFTIYDGVFKLQPGGHWILGTSGGPKIDLYWRLDQAAERGRTDGLRGDETELVDSLEALLTDAVSRRMVSDVPLGAFLSGGYDSSTVVALMQKSSSRRVKTYTVNFTNTAFDESVHAAAVAAHLGTDHTTFTVSGAEALAVVPKLADMYDEPFADSSQIPTHLISAATRRHVTVALSGDGGDELFTGYNRYQWADFVWRSSRHVPVALRRGVGHAIQSIPMHWYDGLARGIPYVRQTPQVGHKVHRYAQMLDASNVDEIYRRLVSQHARPRELVPAADEVLGDAWSEDLATLVPDAVDRMRYLDMKTYLPEDILAKVDRASMAVALEVRIPFLDHRLVEWVWRLPAYLNARAARPKHLLRRVLSRYVPDRLVDRPKMGFGVPLAEWMRGALRDWAEDLVSQRSLQAGGVLDAMPIRAMWEQLVAGDDRHQYSLWNVVMFQAWQRRWGAEMAGAADGRISAPAMAVS